MFYMQSCPILATKFYFKILVITQVIDKIYYAKYIVKCFSYVITVEDTETEYY